VDLSVGDVGGGVWKEFGLGFEEFEEPKVRGNGE
jgi:hypothetical protein